MAVRFIVSLVFAILVAIFALQNSSSVIIKFLFLESAISQALVILISAIVGAVIVLILSTITQFKQNRTVKNSTKTIAALEEENRLLTHRIEELTKPSDVKCKEDSAGVSNES